MIRRLRAWKPIGSNSREPSCRLLVVLTSANFQIGETWFLWSISKEASIRIAPFLCVIISMTSEVGGFPKWESLRNTFLWMVIHQGCLCLPGKLLYLQFKLRNGYQYFSVFHCLQTLVLYLQPLSEHLRWSVRCSSPGSHCPPLQSTLMSSKYWVFLHMSITKAM